MRISLTPPPRLTKWGGGRLRLRPGESSQRGVGCPTARRDRANGWTCSTGRAPPRAQPGISVGDIDPQLDQRDADSGAQSVSLVRPSMRAPRYLSRREPEKGISPTPCFAPPAAKVRTVLRNRIIPPVPAASGPPSPAQPITLRLSLSDGRTPLGYTRIREEATDRTAPVHPFGRMWKKWALFRPFRRAPVSIFRPPMITCSWNADAADLAESRPSRPCQSPSWTREIEISRGGLPFCYSSSSRLPSHHYHLRRLSSVAPRSGGPPYDQ